MNLVRDAWIPVRRKSATHEVIAPWQITVDHDSDPVVAVAWPRADFSAAVTQLLIGLLQTVAAPTTGSVTTIPWLKEHPTCPSWEKWMEIAPSPEELKKRLALVADAFEFDEVAERVFLCDKEMPAEGDKKPISALLIEAPGEQTIKDNTDHFIKRGYVEQLCLECAAAALYTLQSNAPSGGQGHRTSPRGGGPLTTMVVMDPVGGKLEETIWRDLWLNVLPVERIESMPGNSQSADPSAIFPWLMPVKTSEGDRQLAPDEAHPLQIYFPVPRRIRIDFDGIKSGACSVCQKQGKVLSSYWTKNYGVKYGTGWHHPLTPYYTGKDDLVLPVLAKPAAIAYSRWLDITGVQAAAVVERFRTAELKGVQLRVWASGFETDNMKAVSWVETTIPLYLLPPGQREMFEALVQRLIDSASATATAVKQSVRQAWISKDATVSGDLNQISDEFLQQTENVFFSHLLQLKVSLGSNSGYEDILRNWLSVLTRHAESVFDLFVTSGDFQYSNPERISAAHKTLVRFLFGKKLKDILSLSVKEAKDRDANPSLV